LALALTLLTYQPFILYQLAYSRLALRSGLTKKPPGLKTGAGRFVFGRLASLV